MQIVTISEAKARLSQLIRRACQGEEIVIARGSKPLVRLVSVMGKPARTRKPGALKGRLFVPDDFFDPLTDEELKELGFE
jgi:prevent-host-death family protein